MGGATSDPDQIQKLIYDYYKQLFGRQQARCVGLSENVWAEHGRISNLDNDELIKPFSLDEVKQMVFSIKKILPQTLMGLVCPFISSVGRSLRMTL